MWSLPHKRPWLCRNGVSFPSWGLLEESLAREALLHGRSWTWLLPGLPPQAWACWDSICVLPPCQELVEFYQQNSLKDCFKSLDTTLQFPFKEPERRAISKPTGRMHQAGGLQPPLLHMVERKDIPSGGHGEVLSVNQQGPFLLLLVPLLLNGLHGWVGLCF